MPSQRSPQRARKQLAHGTGDLYLDQLNRLLAVARSIDGEVAGVPAHLWWSAFLLVLIDTGLRHRELLTTPRRSFDADTARLAVGLFAYELHPHAARALVAILKDRAVTLSRAEPLFPWPWSTVALTKRLRRLLDTAECPHLIGLQATVRQRPELLDDLNLSLRVGSSVLNQAEPILLPTSSAPAGSLVAFAEEYPTFRLQLKGNSAYLLKIVAQMLTDYYGKLIKQPGEPLMLESLNAPLVLGWMKSLLADGLSPRTVNSHRGSIMTLWRMAHAKGRAPREPSILDLPKCQVPINTPVAWRTDQIQRLVDVCDRLTGFLQVWPSIRLRDYWFSLILFLYESGARIGAALAVKPSDIDLTEQIVTLRSDSAKTQTEQPIRISTPCANAIALILDPQRDTVWPCGKWRHELYHRLKALLTEAGLPTDRKSKFHRIRRTTATHTALHGSLDMAQRQLAHTSLSMTLKYIDPRILRPVQAVDVIPSLVPSGKVS